MRAAQRNARPPVVVTPDLYNLAISCAKKVVAGRPVSVDIQTDGIPNKEAGYASTVT